MKKIAILFLVMLMVGCGVSTDTTVKYDSESDKVVLTSYIEVDIEYYDYVVGGRKAVTTAMSENIWEDGKITEEKDGYKITTNFNSLEDYNKFMKDKSGSEGIEKTSNINVLTVESDYVFSESTSKYLDDFVEDVKGSLELSEEVEYDISASSHSVENYVNDNLVKDVGGGSKARYDATNSKLTLKMDSDISGGDIETEIKSFDLEFEVEIATETHRDQIKKNFEDSGFDTKVSGDVLKVSGSFEDEDDFPKNLVIIYPEIECSLDEEKFLTNKYSCDVSLSYADGLAANVNMDGSRLSSSVPVTVVIDGKDISEELGEEITDLKIVNVIIVSVASLFGLALLVVIYKLLKKKYREKGIVKGLGESKVATGMKSATKSSFATIKEEVKASKISFRNNEEDQTKKRGMLEALNDFVEIRLIGVLFILFSPIYGFNYARIGDSGVYENNDISGQGFVHEIIGKDEAFKEIVDALHFGFGEFLKITMIVLTIVMLLKWILTSVKILKLTPLLNKLIEIFYYALLLITFIILFIFFIANDAEFVTLNLVYYILPFIAIYSIVKALVGFGKNFKMSMFSKYYIIIILMNFLNIYGFKIETDYLVDVTYYFSFSHYLLASNLVSLAIMTVVCVVIVLVFLVLDLLKIFGTIAGSILVYLNSVLYLVLFIVYVFAINNAGDGTFTGALYEMSFVVRAGAVVFFIINFLMVVYSIVATVVDSKEKAKKRREAYQERMSQHQM